MYGDNNPFGALEMLKFASLWDFKIITSSPRYSQSNGAAERFVAIAKNMISKCAQDKSDLQLALLRHRTTPIPSIGYSPSQILNSRLLRSRIPVHANQLQPAIVPNVKEKLLAIQSKMSEGYNLKAKRNVQFELEQNVYIQPQPKSKWIPGKIVRKCNEPRSYEVDTQNGYLRRNAHHIKPAYNNVLPWVFSYNPFVENIMSETGHEESETREVTAVEQNSDQNKPSTSRQENLNSYPEQSSQPNAPLTLNHDQTENLSAESVSANVETDHDSNPQVVVQTEESNGNEAIELADDETQRGNLLQLENLFEELNDLFREFRRPNVEPNHSTPLQSQVSQPKPRGAALKAQGKITEIFSKKNKKQK